MISSSDDDNYAFNSDNDTTVETDIGNYLNIYKCKYKNEESKSSKISEVTISSSSDDEFDDISALRSLREKLQMKYNVPSISKNVEPKTGLENLSQPSDCTKAKNDIVKSSNISKETFSLSLDDEFDDIARLRSFRTQTQSMPPQIKHNIPSTSKNLNLFPDDNELKNSLEDLSQSSSVESNEPNIGVSKPKKSRFVNNEDKIKKKLEKEQEKARKQAEKERLKAEAAKTKAEKQAIASAYKNLKPDECIKFITALIDSELISHECGTDIPNVLQSENVTYKIHSNIHPFTVTWKRNNQSQLTNIDGQLKVTKNEDHCEEVLLIMMWNEFVQLVHENNICNNFKIAQSLLSNKKIFLSIYGIENYFRFQKSRKQKITGKDKIYAESPKISRTDADMSLIELQLLFGTSHRFVETPHDVSRLVLQFSKSVAQIPYKIQKHLKQQQMDWFVSGDNKDCVRVDKNGNGLYRLWQQQLTQLTMARLETADAVTSKYPSPSCLMQAYEDCETVEQGKKLLQDIPIRRAAGPITSERKIGPEFSKKMHTLFTSLDGDIYL